MSPVISLRAPTVDPDVTLPDGHTYILVNRPTMTVRELIVEKVRSELRKIRFGGPDASSLRYLLPDGVRIGTSPLDEQILCNQALNGFLKRQYAVLVDRYPVVDPEEVLSLTRRTSIMFVVNSAPRIDLSAVAVANQEQA